MEKIIYVTHSSDFLNGSFEFATYLAKYMNAVLVGVILENLDWEEIPVAKRFMSQPYIDYTISTALPENESRRAQSEALMQKFKSACIKREVRYKVHIDRGNPVNEILEESRFADIIVIDPAISFSGKDDDVPTHFVTKILRNSECPVVIAPEYFEQIDRVVFAYDGGKDAVFAIKQFTYLFPELRDVKATLLEILDKDQKGITEKYKLKEWLGMHYSDVELISLDGDGENRLMEYLMPLNNTFIVMDGFYRNTMSKLFSPSFSEPIVRVLPLPVFIAHAGF